ncbi:MAG: hypothetical protein EA369_03405 [Bradymonadales bacterium]|nr:MAG: hypothetical protein EA369_03405 [Bradymonadales bacterium]
METQLRSFDLSRPQGSWLQVAKKMETVLPKLYAQENARDSICYFKLFLTCAGWTWCIFEGEWQDDGFFMFGGIIGFEKELCSTRDQLGLGVGLDAWFKPCYLSKIRGEGL